MGNQNFASPKIPLDQDGFAVSFDLEKSSIEDLSAFYNKFGFLIFRDVIDEDEINKTVDSLWQETISFWKTYTGKEIERNNPETWKFIQGFPSKFGFVNQDILISLQIWKNRQNKKIYHSFKKAYEVQSGKKLTQPLIACIDRGSMMRPTLSYPEFKTNNFYHFDIDPWVWTQKKQRNLLRYPKYDYNEDLSFYLMGEGNYEKNVGYTKFAGVLALSDTNQNSGGFECVCGFQNYIKAWCQANPHHKHIQDDENLMKNFQKIFLRKGSLLVFSRQLPHNIYPNNSDNFRYAQYLRMHPLSCLELDEDLIEKRKSLIKKLIPKQLDVSDPISKEIFMLD